MLIQLISSGTGFDNYGITKINFQRRTPLTVVVPLDNPEASSFIRSAPPASTPKKRKKAVDDKLQASDDYTGSRFGDEFPGREVRVVEKIHLHLQRLEMTLNHHLKVEMKLKKHLLLQD